MEKQFNEYFGNQLNELAERLGQKTESIENIIEDENALDEMEDIFMDIDRDFKSTCYDIFEKAEASAEWKEDEDMFSNIISVLKEVKENIIRMKREILDLVVPDFSMAC